MYSNFVTWQVGFTFQMPLGMRAPLANTRSAQYSLLRARAYLQQVVHQTTHSLARFFLEIDANYKQFKTASRLRAAAAQRLDAQRAYYEEGRITIDRFLDAVSQYATAVATEAQYKTTYNISIVALEEAKGTLLAYDNIAVAEGPHPAKAYVQARDIQNAHRQHHIPPDGPQVPTAAGRPAQSRPARTQPAAGCGRYDRFAVARLAPRARSVRPPLRSRPYTPADLLPSLSQNDPDPGLDTDRPPARQRWHRRRETDVGGDRPAVRSRSTASLIDPTVPGMGSSSVAASLGRSGPPAARCRARRRAAPAIAATALDRRNHSPSLQPRQPAGRQPPGRAATPAATAAVRRPAAVAGLDRTPPVATDEVDDGISLWELSKHC